METPPDQPRIGWATSMAENLLRDEEIYAPAVPIDELLEQYATIVTFNDPFLSTNCFEHDSLWHVEINEMQTLGERHYAEALTLGHLKLHHLDYDLDALTDSQLALLNCEAICFADCITMPMPWVLAACPHGRVNYASADTLAGLFSVSRSAALHRLHDLGLYAPEDFHDWRHPYHPEKSHIVSRCTETGATKNNDPFHH